MKTFEDFTSEINKLPRSLKPTSTKMVTMVRSDGGAQTVKHERYNQTDELTSEILKSNLTMNQKLSLIEIIANKYPV